MFDLVQDDAANDLQIAQRSIKLLFGHKTAACWAAAEKRGGHELADRMLAFDFPPGIRVAKRVGVVASWLRKAVM